MKIKFDRTKEQLDLVKAMASSDRQEALAAQEAMAQFMGPVLAEVIDTAPTMSNYFETMPYNPDENPSFPVDLYADITDEDFLKIYSQSVPGGLPTNEVVVPSQEMKMTTYSLDSAWSFDSKYARRSRLDVVAKTFQRMAQEIMLKQEATSANAILGTLADNEATSVVTGSSTTLLPADFNALIVKAKRVNSSWTGGTPAGRVGGVTDIVLSPERMADLRAMAYNPINTVGSSAGVASVDAGIAAPEAMRQSMFNGAGFASFYGLGITEINELGVGQKYSKVFEAAGATFDSSADDLVLALDLSRESMIRAVSTDPDSNSSLSIEVDDQFVARQKKIGWYLGLEEGRVILDWRVLFGIKIDSASA